MTAPEARPVHAVAVPFARPDPLSLSFEGWGPDTFRVLEHLRQNPHVEGYRAVKGDFARYVREPFKRYRDDLAVNWVLPNRLPFATEKGVFSRILKNDFGAGGSHHHLWMAFYRPPRKRLTDLQLSHAIYPDKATFGLYVGEYSKGLFRAARARMLAEEQQATALLNALIEGGYRFAFAPHVTKPDGHPEFDTPLGGVPDAFARAKGVWVRREVPRAEALALGPGLVAEALKAQEELWPLYRFWAEAEDVMRDS